MARVIWKGAISFGLVHVPVALYPASRDIGIDFDWLDKRSMDPVGYKRINKRTGKEIDKENIVKGMKQEGGDYVLMSDDEIAEAYPKTTQTIEIETFVKAGEIPFTMLERPYFLEPIGKGDKVYALLREAIREAGVIGIARVVMHTKEHLAALIASGPALMLNTIRWDGEMLAPTELNLPPEGKGANVKPTDLKMARQLIGEMTKKWAPGDYTDKFTHAIHELAKNKVKAGDTEKVTPMEEAPEGGERASNVVDLTELLQRSLGGKGKAGAKDAASSGKGTAPAKAAGAKAVAAKTPRAKAAPAKTAARKRA